MRTKTILLIFTILILAPHIFATDWYVRPEGGNYGAENGTSYADAWDGLKNIIWGTGGVQAGDTLYICGLHVHNMTNTNNNTSQADIALSVSGSSGNEIIIRGDYPGDAGIIWGAFKQSYEAWVDEGSNVYSTTYMSNNSNDDFYFEDITAGSYTLLAVVTSEATCAANAGSVFPDPDGEGKIFVHCSDDGNPTGRIYLPSWGYDFKMNGRSNIQFINLTFYIAGSRMFFYRGDGKSADHITWDGCTIWYRTDLAFDSDSSYLVFNNCDIAWERGGIDLGTSSNATITNCTIHDIGVRASTYNSDAHGVAANGSSGGLISGNEIYNCGSGITYYAYPTQDCDNNIIRWNYIHDMHTNGSANARGIEMNMDGTNVISKSGNQIYGNIAVVSGHAYRSTWTGAASEIEWFNNIAYGANISFYFNQTYGDYGCYMELKNNISLSPVTSHIYFGCDDAEGNYKVDSDYNCWYPDGAAFFRLKDFGGQTNTNWAGWQGLSKSGCTFDPNGINSDPLFVNAGGSYTLDTDFKLQSDSPAIDEGTDVGLTQDYEGTPIPQGLGPDIGAYECVKLLYAKINASPIAGELPLTVYFEGNATGDYPPFLYKWKFGDGGTSTEKIISHSYSEAGEYEATLTVIDNNANTESDSITIDVFPPAYHFGLSVFTHPPTPGEGGQTDPPAGDYFYPRDSSLEVKALPYPHYRLSRWAGDVKASDIYMREITLLLDRDKSITANFCAECGDINGDLNITPIDAQIAFDVFLGNITNLTKAQKENADVNCDGTTSDPRITPGDAQAIFAKFLGISELPCDCSGGFRTETMSIQTKNAPEISLMISDEKMKLNEEIFVRVIINSPININAFGFDIIFPSDIFEFVSLKRSGFSKDCVQVDTNQIGAGFLRVGGFAANSIKCLPQTILVTLVFKVVGKAKENSKIVLTNTVDDIKNSSVCMSRMY